MPSTVPPSETACMLKTYTNSRAPKLQRWLPSFLSGYQRSWLAPDLIAGLTLAAVAIPECMGYTKIAGTPVITGLYTLLLPILAFALLGSSRHLVVGADSATAAILFAGLLGLAAPYSQSWLDLASLAALLTAAFLFLASVLRLGFLADFLSRTVLVGFLSGVGLSLLLGELPDMLGLTLTSHTLLPRLLELFRALPHTHLLTLLMTAGVLALILLFERAAPKLPGSLVAVALAIAATWVFRLDQHGFGFDPHSLSVVGSVHAGLPSFHLPAVTIPKLKHLLPMSASLFLVILAQSAATSRSFAQRYDERLSPNRDLVALGAGNALAGLSGTFVINGSPTKTAVVASAGGRTQVAQLTTAALTLIVLLFATSLIARLPNAALAALVFLIGARLVDVKSLRQIYQFRKLTFAVAVATMLGVLLLGVERGIFLAIALSVIDHLRQEYHPKDVVLTHAPETGTAWKAVKAEAGIQTAPGLLVYRFEAPLFFANADYFSLRIMALIDGAPQPIKRLVLDLVSMDDIDYTAMLTLSSTLHRLQQQGVNIALAQTEDVQNILDKSGITKQLGTARIYPTVQEAVEALPIQ
jgi:SulP family sulfate permease